MERGRFILAGVMLFVSIGVWQFSTRRQEQVMAEAEQETEGMAPATARPPEPVKPPGLDSLRAAWSAAQTPAQKRDAEQALRRELNAQLERALAAGKPDEAKAPYEELKKEHRGSRELRQANERWAQDRIARVQAASSKLDWEVLENVIPEILDDPSERGASSVEDPRQRLAGHFLELFRHAKDTGPQLDALSRAASAGFTPEDTDNITDALAVASPRPDYETLAAQAQAGLKPAAAFVLLKAALKNEKLAADKARLRTAADKALLRLVRERRSGDFVWMSWSAAQQSCLAIAQRAAQEARVGRVDARADALLWGFEAIKALGEVTPAQLRWLAEEGDFERADRVAKVALGEGGARWLDLESLRTGGEPLRYLPAAVRDELAEAEPRPEGRVRNARERVLSGDLVLEAPEFSQVRSALGDLSARWGLQLIAAREVEARERGAALLRRVLREHASEPSGAMVVNGLTVAFDAAAAAKDFDLLFDLSGLYLTERTDKAPDAAKKQLLAAAQHFGRTTHRGLFMLTLVADAFPGDPDGEAARKQAMAAAFEVRANSDSAQPQLADGLQGAKGSVYCAENGTSQHLLAFFDGPEQFFVRINPSRRGVVALENGSYRHVALITNDSVVPYQGQLQLKGNVLNSRYYVRSSRGRDDGASFATRAAAGTGEWLPLRPGQNPDRRACALPGRRLP